MSLLGPAWKDIRTSMVDRMQKSGDHPLCARFCESFGYLVRQRALRSGVPESEVADVVQEVFLSMVESLAEFDRVRAPFRSWLYMLTMRRIADWQRRNGRRPVLVPPPSEESSTSTAPVERCPDENPLEMASFYQDEWLADLYRVAEDTVSQRLPGDYQYYSALVHDHLAADQVANLLGVSPERVYVAKNRIVQALKEEIHRLEEGDGFVKT